MPPRTAQQEGLRCLEPRYRSYTLPSAEDDHRISAQLHNNIMNLVSHSYWVRTRWLIAAIIMLFSGQVLAQQTFSASVSVLDTGEVLLLVTGHGDAEAAQRQIAAELDAAGLTYAVQPVTAATLHPATALGASSVLADRQPRSPEFGLLFAFLVPGGGHFYAGETGRGIVLLSLGLGVPLVAGLVAQNEGLGGVGIGLVGTAIGLGAWIYGMIDAMPAVRRSNARASLALAPAAVPSGRTLAPGTRLTLTF